MTTAASHHELGLLMITASTGLTAHAYSLLAYTNSAPPDPVALRSLGALLVTLGAHLTQYADHIDIPATLVHADAKEAPDDDDHPEGEPG